MTWKQISGLLVVATILACGQLLFKIAAQSVKGPVALQTVLQLLLNPYVLFGLALYGVATVAWLLLLRQMELTKAYPMVALSIVLVTIAGAFFLREPLSISLLMGLVIILIGLAMAWA